MKDISIEQIQGLMDAFTAKDMNAMLHYFAEDVVLIDPHYPFPEMRGKAAITTAMEWAFGNMEKPGFRIKHIWIENGNGAVEVDTHHVFRGGMVLRFPQVFVFESRDGLITRLQSFVPYPPPGVGGLLTKLTRWWWVLTGKAKVFRG